MGCPDKHTLTGSGRVNVGFFSSSAVAEAEASALVQTRAETDAGLAFNKFECEGRLCLKKSMGAVTVTPGAVWSSRLTLLGLLASLFWAGWRYEGKADYTWSVEVTCYGEHSPLLDPLQESFTVDAAIRSNQVFTIASGWLNNILSWIGFGRGCADWADWIRSWIYREGWDTKGVRPRICWYWVHWWFITQHQVVVITMPDGQEYVLDPYTDPVQPVWDKGQYERLYGKLHCSD